MNIVKIYNGVNFSKSTPRMYSKPIKLRPNGFDKVELSIQTEKKEQNSRDKYLNELLNRKPQYVEMPELNEKIKGIGMRHQYVTKATETDSYVGTIGLGPCIGLSIVGEKSGKPVNIGVAHIDALTDLKSLLPFVFDSAKGSDSIKIRLISSKNQINKAKQILEKIFEDSDITRRADVFCDLTRSKSFAVNTRTGDISVDVPSSMFEFKGVEKKPSTLYLLSRSGLYRSNHYKK